MSTTALLYKCRRQGGTFTICQQYLWATTKQRTEYS